MFGPEVTDIKYSSTTTISSCHAHIRRVRIRNITHIYVSGMGLDIDVLKEYCRETSDITWLQNEYSGLRTFATSFSYKYCSAAHYILFTESLHCL